MWLYGFSYGNALALHSFFLQIKFDARNCSADFYLNVCSYLHICNRIVVKPACNLDVCKYSFSSRVVDLWNSLPQHVVNLSTVDSFKSALNVLDFTALCDFSIY
jgi:hypothetical protein